MRDNHPSNRIRYSNTRGNSLHHAALNEMIQHRQQGPKISNREGNVLSVPSRQLHASPTINPTPVGRHRHRSILYSVSLAHIFASFYPRTLSTRLYQDTYTSQHHAGLTPTPAQAMLYAMALFTAETARQAGIKSAQIRAEERKRPLVFPSSPVDLAPDPFTDALACACGETLKELREMIVAHKAPQAAQLARALRDLRETWHLATGKPKPGQLRPDTGKTPRPRMPSVYPTVYGPQSTDQKPTESSG